MGIGRIFSAGRGRRKYVCTKLTLRLFKNFLMYSAGDLAKAFVFAIE
jgi:hypothetical protein